MVSNKLIGGIIIFLLVAGIFIYINFNKENNSFESEPTDIEVRVVKNNFVDPNILPSIELKNLECLKNEINNC